MEQGHLFCATLSKRSVCTAGIKRQIWKMIFIYLCIMWHFLQVLQLKAQISVGALGAEDLSPSFTERLNRLTVKVKSTFQTKTGELCVFFKPDSGGGVMHWDFAHYHLIQSPLSTNVKVIFGVTSCGSTARMNVMSKLKCPICDFQSFG